jgi:hypothetical protein
MKKNTWRSLLIAAVVLIPVAYWLWRDTGSGVGIDLVEALPAAEKRTNRPIEENFTVLDQTIAAETRRAIFAHPHSRITWRLTLPRDAWLRVWLGLKPEAWDQEGDGVLFRIGISDTRNYDEVLNQMVDPFANADDRRWIPVELDLSAYAGQQVEIIFNTNPSGPEKKKGDTRNDLAVWGAPEIYIR